MASPSAVPQVVIGKQTDPNPASADGTTARATHATVIDTTRRRSANVYSPHFRRFPRMRWNWAAELLAVSWMGQPGENSAAQAPILQYCALYKRKKMYNPVRLLFHQTKHQHWINEAVVLAYSLGKGLHLKQ